MPFFFAWEYNASVVFAILLILSAAPLHAERLPIRKYTTSAGLASNNVHRIRADSQGFIWFGTAEGLARYDGYSFTNYTEDNGLPHAEVHDIVEARDGAYWVATSGGLCRLDTRAFSRGKPRCEIFRPEAEAMAQWFNDLLEDTDGSLWCGTRAGLFKLERKRERWAFRKVDLGPIAEPWSVNVEALHRDRAGNVWAGALSGLYRIRSGAGVERYTDELEITVPAVLAIAEDARGRIWVGTEHGIRRLLKEPRPGRTAVDLAFNSANGLPHNYVQSLLAASDGQLWVASMGGLAVLDPLAPSPAVKAYSSQDDKSLAHAETLAEDSDHNIWIGAYRGGGAFRIARGGLTTFGVADGLGAPSVVSLIESPKKELIAVSRSAGNLSLNRFDGSRFHAITPRLRDSVKAFGRGLGRIVLFDHAGQWWVATGEGLGRFPRVSDLGLLARTPPSNWYSSLIPPTGSNIFQIFEDSRGDIWISTSSGVSNGLIRWQRATGTFRIYSEADGLPSLKETLPSAFHEDRAGNLWIGFEKTAIGRLRPDRLQLFRSAEGAPAGGVSAFFEEKSGRLWLASDTSGLSYTDNPDAEQPRFVTYSIKDGLSSNIVNCITADLRGRIYVGTASGVDRVEFSAKHPTPHVRQYNTEHGLAGGLVQVALRDSHGALWFGTPEGLSRLVPEPEEAAAAPKVRISALFIRGVRQTLSDLGEEVIRPMTLKANENQVRLEFVASSFRAGDNLRYQHLLEGTGDTWSVPSDQRTVNYAHLSPGEYRFLVRAMNADGITGPPAEYSFQILAPVWRRWWFLTTTAILLCVGAWALHLLLINRAREMERLRTRIATELHDDVGSSLSQIAVLTETVRQHANQMDGAAAERLSRAASISRELVDTMSDIVWAINPSKDRLHDLVPRMRRFASDLLGSRNIDLRLRGPGQDMPLDPDTRRQIFLIYKECIHNIARHSGCTSVAVDLELAEETLVMRITDNGKGFRDISRTEGQGVRNLNLRAERLNGTFQVHSEQGLGTIVTLRLPLRQRRFWFSKKPA